VRPVERGKADVADRGQARPDQDRRAVDRQPVDQTRGKEGGSRLRAALDVEVLHVGHGMNRAGLRQRAPARRRFAAREHPAFGAAMFEPRQPHVEPRRIGAQRAAADQDRVGLRAHRVAVGAGGGAGDPVAFAVGQGNAAVERGRQLERDVGRPRRRSDR